MEQCRLADDSAFVKRYPEFVGYIKTLALERQPDHELGFNVPDSVYFSETRAYVTIPDFLLTPNFLRAVTRFIDCPAGIEFFQHCLCLRQRGETSDCAQKVRRQQEIRN